VTTMKWAADLEGELDSLRARVLDLEERLEGLWCRLMDLMDRLEAVEKALELRREGGR